MNEQVYALISAAVMFAVIGGLALLPLSSVSDILINHHCRRCYAALRCFSGGVGKGGGAVPGAYGLAGAGQGVEKYSVRQIGIEYRYFQRPTNDGLYLKVICGTELAALMVSECRKRKF